MTETTPKCIHCDRDNSQIPLLKFQYQNDTHWICPQHFPILIHKPHQLADKLPGADQWEDEGAPHGH